MKKKIIPYSLSLTKDHREVCCPSSHSRSMSWSQKGTSCGCQSHFQGSLAKSHAENNSHQSWTGNVAQWQMPWACLTVPHPGFEPNTWKRKKTTIQSKERPLSCSLVQSAWEDGIAEQARTLGSLTICFGTSPLTVISCAWVLCLHVCLWVYLLHQETRTVHR